MKIREIKDEKLRELALRRREEYGLPTSESDNLWFAFEWAGTPEGAIFWSKVNRGKITSLPEPAPSPEPQFTILHGFTIDELIEWCDKEYSDFEMTAEIPMPQKVKEKYTKQMEGFHALSDLLKQIKSKEAQK